MFLQLEPCELVSETKLDEKWSLKRLSSHASWGCWLDQYRERLDKEAGQFYLAFIFNNLPTAAENLTHNATQSNY